MPATDAEIAAKVRANLLKHLQRDARFMAALKAHNALSHRNQLELHELQTVTIPRLLAEVERDRSNAAGPG